MEPTRAAREAMLEKEGYPAYTTQVGWINYSDEKVRSLGRRFLEDGFTAFKMKVGANLEDDKRRLRYIYLTK
jgi:L-fuconate dehydratase